MIKSKELYKRIAAYSSVAGSVLVAPTSSSAQIQYTDINPDFIGTPYTFYDLDLNNDGVADFRIQQDYYSVYVSSSSSENDTWYYGRVQVLGLNDGEIAVQASNNHFADFKKIDENISGNLSWKKKVEISGYNQFVGLRLNDGGNYYYGWLRIELEHDAISFTAHDYAINAVAGDSIHAGEGFDCNRLQASIFSAGSCLLNASTIKLKAIPSLEESYTWLLNGDSIAGGANTFSASEQGYYQIAITDFFGCRDTSNAVKVSKGSTISTPGIIKVSNELQCSPAKTYQWFRGDNPIDGATNYNHSPPENGLYSVVIGDDENCMASASINYVDCEGFEVEIISLFEPEDCPFKEVPLVSSVKASSYFWQLNDVEPPGYFINYQNVLIATTNGDYRLMATDDNGCTDTSDYYHLIVNTITTAPSIHQIGDSLVSSPASSYQWYKNYTSVEGATNQVYLPDELYQYKVAITDSGICPIGSLLYSYWNCNTKPVIYSSQSPPDSHCEGTQISFQLPSHAATYQWLKEGVPYLFEYTANANHSIHSFSFPPGAYQVIIADPTGCKDTSDAYLINNTNVSIIQSGDSLLADQTYGLQWLIEKPGYYVDDDYFYDYYDVIQGEINSYYIPAKNGNYSVIYNDTLGCSSQAYYTFYNCHLLKVISDPIDSFYCGTTGYFYVKDDFNQYEDSVHYKWYKNGLNIPYASGYSLYTNSAGAYTLYVSTDGGCEDSSTINISGEISPATPEINRSGDTLYSDDESFYQWILNGQKIPGATDQQIVPTGDGSYQVEITDEAGCKWLSDPYPVYQCLGFTDGIASSGFDTLCAGGSVTYEVPLVSSYQYQWRKNQENISGATNNTHAATSTGHYSVIITIPDCCSDTLSSKTLVINSSSALPTITLSNDTLISSSSTGNSWYKDNCCFVSGASFQKFIPVESGSYQVFVTDSNGCQKNSTPVSVTVPSPCDFSIYAAYPLEVCTTTKSISVVPGLGNYNYQWQKDGLNYSTYYNLNVSQSGNYWAIVTGPGGCADTTEEVTIAIHPPFYASISQAGDTLVGVAGAQNLWYGDYGYNPYDEVLVGNTYKFVPPNLGDYTLVATTVYGCTATSYHDYDDNCNELNVLLVNEIHACGTATLSIPYYTTSTKWYKNSQLFSQGSGFFPLVTTETGYYFCIINTEGCTDTSNTVHIDADPFSIPVITQHLDTIFSTGSGTFIWYSYVSYYTQTLLATTSVNFFIPEKPGTYYVKVIDTNNCSGVSANYYFFDCGIISHAITYSDTVVQCSSNFTLSYYNNYSPNVILSYQWYKDDLPVPGATNYNYSANGAGNYFGHITSSTGCSFYSDTVTVIPDTPLIATLTFENEILSTVQGAAFYEWYYLNDGIPGANDYYIVPNLEGDYKVNVYDSLYCVSTATKNVHPCDVYIQNGCTNSICSGSAELFGFVSGNNSTLIWLLNGIVIPGTSTLNYSATFPGSYQLVMTKDNCSDTSNVIEITSLAFLTEPTATLENDTLFSTLADSYQWYFNNAIITGATNYFYIPEEWGFYSVLVTDSGCSFLSPQIIFVDCSGISDSIYAEGNPPLCEGDNTVLHVLVTNSDVHVWYFEGTPVAGGTGDEIIADESGTYLNIATDNLGCTDTSNVIFVNPSPSIPVISQINDSLVSTPSFSYQWYENGNTISGATNQTFLPQQSGNYSVTITNSLCGAQSSPFLFCSTYHDSIYANLPQPLCAGDSIVLSSITDAPLQQWFFNGIEIPGAEANNIFISTDGFFYNETSDTLGCSAISNIIIVHSLPAVPVITQSGDSLYSVPALNYQWYQGELPINGASNQNYFPLQSGYYSVEVSGSFCSSSSMPFFFCLPINDSIFSFNSFPFCEGDTITLVSLFENASLQQWYYNNTEIPGATSNQIIVSQAGEYFNVAFDLIGCADTSNVVQVNTIPYAPEIYAMNDSLFCNELAFAYQWYLNGTAITGASDFFYVPTGPGIFSIEITDSNGCVNESTPFNYIFSSAGFVIPTQISLLPNPNRGHFTIIASELEGKGISLEIRNSIGQIILSEKVISFPPSYSITVSSPAPGFYWCEFRNEEGFAVIAFIIQ